MNIGILGTGMVGQTIAGKLDDLGHSVVIGTRDVEATLANTSPNAYGLPPFSAWYKQQTKVKLGNFADAAGHGEVLINCSSGVASLDALKSAGEKNLSGKILLDISNPLDFSKGFPPTLTVCNTDSLGEQIQRAFPETKVVKTLNTVNAMVMVNPLLVPGDHNLFICGNDSDAKASIVNLLKTFGWKEINIIDLGDITNARATEMLLPIWVRLYGKLQTPMFNFNVVVGK
ncbi:MAG: NAD(P)-binding domain-containing protein [Ignavibacteriaceae bacterium]|nr:NAD(P)-binding domain-containing protein [Ignavibacteriaceae bacterium]